MGSLICIALGGYMALRHPRSHVRTSRVRVHQHVMLSFKYLQYVRKLGISAETMIFEIDAIEIRGNAEHNNSCEIVTGISKNCTCATSPFVVHFKNFPVDVFFNEKYVVELY